MQNTHRLPQVLLVALASLALILGFAPTAGSQTLIDSGTSTDPTVLPPEPNCGDPIDVSVLTGDEANSLSPPRFGIGGGMVPTAEVAVDLPAGRYRIESVTVDRYDIRATTGLQANEQVRLRFFSGATEQDVTPYTVDLIDGFEAAWAITDLGVVDLADGADRIVVEHYGHNNAINSPDSLKVSSICALLEEPAPTTTTTDPCADDDGDDDGIPAANDIDDPCGPCTDGDNDGITADTDIDDPCGPCADDDGDDDGIPAANDIDDPCGPCTDGDNDGITADTDADDPCGSTTTTQPTTTTTEAPTTTTTPPPTVAPTTVIRTSTTAPATTTTAGDTETTPTASVLGVQQDRDDLAVTGSSTLRLVWIGSLATAVGVLLVAFAVRRREFG